MAKKLLLPLSTKESPNTKNARASALMITFVNIAKSKKQNIASDFELAIFVQQDLAQ